MDEEITLTDIEETIKHLKNNIRRGCRQGDPISRLQFIIFIEILLIKIRTTNTVKPFKLTYNITPLMRLQ